MYTIFHRNGARDIGIFFLDFLSFWSITENFFYPVLPTVLTRALRYSIML